MATAEKATAEKTSAEKGSAGKTGADGEEETTGGRKKLVVILAVVVLVAAAGAWFFLFSGSSAKAAPPEKGAVVALDPIAVNLAGGGYLKIGIALQLTADAGEETPDGSEALDLVIATYSQAKPTDVNGARDALKEALEKKIIDAYERDGTEIVMGIYLTEYVTQ